MHTVELLEQALRLAKSLGYRVRQDTLAGTLGGACEIRGKKWLFLDAALGPVEQLEVVLSALNREPALGHAEVPPALVRLLDIRRTA